MVEFECSRVAKHILDKIGRWVGRPGCIKLALRKWSHAPWKPSAVISERCHSSAEAKLWFLWCRFCVTVSYSILLVYLWKGRMPTVQTQIFAPYAWWVCLCCVLVCTSMCSVCSSVRVYELYYIDVLIPGRYCKQALVVRQAFLVLIPSCSWTPDPSSAAAWMRLAWYWPKQAYTVGDFA